MLKLTNNFPETLRKYPVVPVLNRTCMKDYKIPGSNKIIEKGNFSLSFQQHSN